MHFILFITLAICGAVASVNDVFAQETETASHEFVDQVPTPPPSAAELAQVSALSEKYILGTITTDELTLLKEYKADLADLDAYRKAMETKNAIQAAPSGMPNVFSQQDTISDTGVTLQASSNVFPNWILMYMAGQAVVTLLIAVLLLLQMRKVSLLIK